MRPLPPLILTCFRSSRAHPLRTFLLMFGIALGVAGVIAIDIAKTSVSKSFDLSTAALTARSTHQIMGNDFSIPQSLFTQVRTIAGIKKSAPVISRLVKTLETGTQPLSLMGVDPFSELYFRPIHTSGPGNGDPEAFRTAMTRGQGLVITRELARENGLDTGAYLTLLMGERRIKLPISAIVTGGPAPKALQGVLLADIALAQEILGMGDRISRIDLSLDSPDQIRSVRALLGPGQVLVDTDQRNQTIRSLSLSFETSLTAFSILVLFMGIFLIYNTVSFSVTSRSRLNSTLRALGATKKEIFIAQQTEVTVYAMAGSLLGIALGIVLGKGAVQVVCATVSDMYYTLTVSQTHIAWATLVKGGVTGMGAAFFSSFIPAFNAANTLPITLMQRSSPEKKLKKVLPWLSAAGCCTAGASVFIFHRADAGMGWVFTGVFMVLAGGSLLTPALISGLTTLVDKLFSLGTNSQGRQRIMGQMAVRNIRRSMSRTSVLIASLMVVISVYIGIDTMTLSFRQSIINWVQGHIGGDIHLSSMDELNPGLDPVLLDQVQSMEGVEAVSAYNIHRRFSSRSGEVHIFSYIKDRSIKAWTWLAPQAGLGDDHTINTLLDKGWVIVSEIFARQNGLLPASGRLPSPGAKVVMETLAGEKTFFVAGIFRDFFMGGGRVVTSRNAMKTYWGKDDITAMQIFLVPMKNQGKAPGTGKTWNKESAIKEMIPKIRALAANDAMLRVRSGPEIKARILSVFDKTFLITIALQALTALVALTGIVNSVMALILERARELGILRACGAEPGQVRMMILWECGLSGFMAGVLALPMGLFLSWILVDVVNFRSFGWTYDIRISLITLVQALGFASLAALGAGVVPAVKAGRIPVVDALRTE